MKKLLILLALLIALLATGIAITWWWLTDTRSGAEWALNRAGAYVEDLNWTSLEGSLASGLVLHGVELDQAGTRTTIGQLELSARVRLLARPQVDVQWLRLRNVDVYLPEPEERDPDAPPFKMPDLTSPVAVNIQELLIEHLNIHPHTGDPIRIDRGALAGRYDNRLTLERLELAMGEHSVDGHGEWGLSDPFSGDLVLNVSTLLADDVRQEVTANFSGRLAALELSFHTTGVFTVEGDARLRGLPGDLTGTVRMQGEFVGWPGLADLSISDVDLHVEGSPQDWALTASARVEGMEVPPGHWRLSADGDLQSANIRQLQGEVLEGTVSATGLLALGADPFSASADIRFEGLDFVSLYPEWPDQARVNGVLSARIEGDEIHLDRLDVSAPPTTLKLTGSGRFAPAVDELALDLQWRDFTWPPIVDDSQPLIASESGQIRLSGSISDWRLELDALLETEDMPPATLGLRARGDTQGATLEALALNIGEAGHIRTTGTLAWDPAPATDLDIVLDRFDPGHFITELPGQVDARLALRARHDEHWRIDLNLPELAGQIRNQPLSGSGRVNLVDEFPESARLQISLGDNRLELESDDGDHWSWQVDGQALGQLWPELSGALVLSGVLEPNARRLAASGDFASGGLGDLSVESASVEIDLDWGERPRAEIRILMADVDVNPWERIDQLEASFVGGCVDHRIELNLAGRRGSLDLTGRGTLVGCLAKTERWRVNIERFYLGETVAGNWQLVEPLTIIASTDAIEAGPGCLDAVGNGGRLCLEGLYVDGNSRAQVSIDQVPMDLLLLPFDPVFSLTTPLSGRLETNWTREGLTRLAGHLELNHGALRPLGGEHDLLSIESVRLDFTPQSEHGLVMDLLARLEGDSELKAQANVFDLRDPAATRIDAEARLDLPDIGAFNHLVAELDQLGGQLQGTLSASGALLAPDLNGSLQLIEGHLAHAPLGLKITNIGLVLEGAANHATLRGQMQSGDGSLSLDGTLDQAADGWGMQLEIDGSAFAFADVDWLELTASPQFQVTARPGRLDLDGDIHIDRLRAGLPPGSAERISESPDVHVIGEDEDEEQAKPPARRLHGRLGIHMGDNARLAAEGLQTRLAGSLELLWNGDPMPRGRGVIRLPEGSYREYGQTLEIRDGEVVFTGRPLDNPRLNIRAVRDIFGDPRVDVAGVHIRGNARDPQIDLFTEPPTTEEKALAFMVTGSDFDHAAGRGAVNIGFYLFPRLFVSYGIGLFEAGNVLSGRYELSKRWGVRVVSGERDTGVDLSFQVDR